MKYYPIFLSADVTPPQTAGYLEITDLTTKKLKYIPVPRSTSLTPYTSWLSMISDTDVLLAKLGNSDVVTVDMGGNVRLWETSFESLGRSLQEWRNMIGQEDGRPVQVESACMCQKAGDECRILELECQ
ncbi:UNVERIFIED_CONTAM: hypothetical protein K2H54_005660 [Gekko kuhli]